MDGCVPAGAFLPAEKKRRRLNNVNNQQAAVRISSLELFRQTMDAPVPFERALRSALADTESAGPVPGRLDLTGCVFHRDESSNAKVLLLIRDSGSGSGSSRFSPARWLVWGWGQPIVGGVYVCVGCQ